MKRNAQESAGKANETHAARVGRRRARLDEAGRALRDEQRITLELPDTNVPAGRTVFLGERMQVRYGDRALFAADGVDLTIRGPERIALTGPNGAGKSTLLRLINGELDAGRRRGQAGRRPGRLPVPAAGPAGPRPHAWRRTWPRSRRHAASAQRMNLLARFLFRGSRVHLPVGVLSGGERLRATLACVLCAEPAPQLLLLDEPTNNLDLVSVAQLESALGAYAGRVRGGQPRRAVPRRDRGGPLAAAGERAAAWRPVALQRAAERSTSRRPTRLMLRSRLPALRASAGARRSGGRGLVSVVVVASVVASVVVVDAVVDAAAFGAPVVMS